MKKGRKGHKVVVIYASAYLSFELYISPLKLLHVYTWYILSASSRIN